MSFPNLIIAGAPKCGTSSLFRWLADHPEVCGSTVKETFYLMDKDHPLLRKGSNFHEHGLRGYQTYFNNRSPEHKIVFEATTHYIYQRTPIEVLSQLPQAPRIVFMLRKPSERVYSSFQYTKNNLANFTRHISFSQFIELVKSDPEDSRLRECAGPSAYVLKNDLKYSRYIEYISLWRARFGTERVHVLLFEDMKNNPRGFMKELASRLGIDPGFYDAYDLPARNETLTVNYPSLHRRMKKFNGLLSDGKLKAALKRGYLKAQSGNTKSEKSSEDTQALAELERDFQPFNQRLANELGLDLSAWNQD